MSAQSVSVRLQAQTRPAGLRLIELVVLVAALLALGALLIPLPSAQLESTAAATSSH